MTLTGIIVVGANPFFVVVVAVVVMVLAVLVNEAAATELILATLPLPNRPLHIIFTFNHHYNFVNFVSPQILRNRTFCCRGVVCYRGCGLS